MIYRLMIFLTVINFCLALMVSIEEGFGSFFFMFFPSILGWGIKYIVSGTLKSKDSI